MWTCLITPCLFSVASSPFSHLCTIFLSFLFLSRHMFSPDPKSNASIFMINHLENTEKHRENNRSPLLIPFPGGGAPGSVLGSGPWAGLWPGPHLAVPLVPPPTAPPPVSHSLPLSVSVTVSGLTWSPSLRLSQPVPLSLGTCLCLHGLCSPPGWGGGSHRHPHSFFHKARPEDAQTRSVCLWDGGSPSRHSGLPEFCPRLCVSFEGCMLGLCPCVWLPGHPSA